MTWQAAESSTTLGTTGSENGTIIADDEIPGGARITLEEKCGNGAPFAITCGVPGWFFHTRFFEDRNKAESEFTAMRQALTELLQLEPASTEAGCEPFFAAIRHFVRRFP